MMYFHIPRLVIHYIAYHIFSHLGVNLELMEGVNSAISKTSPSLSSEIIIERKGKLMPIDQAH